MFCSVVFVGLGAWYISRFPNQLAGENTDPKRGDTQNWRQSADHQTHRAKNGRYLGCRVCWPQCLTWVVCWFWGLVPKTSRGNWVCKLTTRCPKNFQRTNYIISWKARGMEIYRHLDGSVVRGQVCLEGIYLYDVIFVKLCIHRSADYLTILVYLHSFCVLDSLIYVYGLCICLTFTQASLPYQASGWYGLWCFVTIKTLASANR